MKHLIVILFIAFSSISVAQQIQDTCAVTAPKTLQKEGRKKQVPVRFTSTCPIRELTITILNRWGNVLFTSNEAEFFWEGDDQSAGTYFYTVKGAFADGSPINQNGFFQLSD